MILVRLLLRILSYTKLNNFLTDHSVDMYELGLWSKLSSILFKHCHIEKVFTADQSENLDSRVITSTFIEPSLPMKEATV